jgi:hypothetical protein
MRAFRVGINRSLFLLYFDDPSFFRKAKRFVRGVCRALIGVAMLLAGMARGRDKVVRAAQRIASGVGTAVGLFGVQYEEYRHTHGR